MNSISGVFDCTHTGLESTVSNAYFDVMPARKLPLSQSGDLFERPAVVGPPGFRYGAELFSTVAEAEFVARFEALPFKPFEFHGYQGNRRIVSYGYRYDYAGRTLRSSEAMPSTSMRSASMSGVSSSATTRWYWT